MYAKRTYVDFHVIQTVPPSCINRDDTGRPKTAVYGGALRARVSSQAWKHAMREMFAEIYRENSSYRTKYAANLVADEMCRIDPAQDPKEALNKAKDILTAVGVLKGKEKKGNTKKTEDAEDSTDKKEANKTLFFISTAQAHALAEAILNFGGMGTKDKLSKKEEDRFQDVLNQEPSVDIALFGRMVANNTALNVDAAAQVAHAISTHAIQNEYDYFTAVDDYKPDDTAGAGFLGTQEYNASTLYRYATVNLQDLARMIGKENAVEAVKAFARAFICSMPTGKKNSYANRTLPDFVYVTIRNDQPVNFCGAFEKPVYSEVGGYVEKSEQKLMAYAQKVYENFCDAPEAGFAIGDFALPEDMGVEKVNLKELLNRLGDMAENEVE